MMGVTWLGIRGLLAMGVCSALLVCTAARGQSVPDTTTLINNWNATSPASCASNGCHGRPVNSVGSSGLASSSAALQRILNLYLLTPPFLTDQSGVPASMRSLCSNAAHTGSYMCNNYDATYLSGTFNGDPRLSSADAVNIYNYLFFARHGVVSAATPAATVSILPTTGSSDAGLAFANTLPSGTSTTVWTVTVSNLRSVGLSLSFSSTNGTDFKISNPVAGSGGCLLTATIGQVAASSSTAATACTFEITYKPQGTSTSARSAILTMTMTAQAGTQSAPLEPQARRFSLSGGVTTVPKFAFTPSTNELTFSATTGTSATNANTATISNTGSADLDLGTITSTGATNGDSYTVDASSGCKSGGTLKPAPDPSASCSLVVSYTAGTAGSERTATLNIPHNDNSSTQPFLVTLKGTSTAVPLPSQTFNGATSLNLGRMALNSSTASQLVTVRNTGTAGTAPLTFTSIASSAPTEFTVTGGSCFATFPAVTYAPVTAGNSCTVLLSFSPQVAGLRQANLVVTSNATTSPANLPLSGTGLAAPNLNVSALNFPNTPVSTTSATTGQVLVTNPRDAAITFTHALTFTNGTDTNDYRIASVTAGAGSTCTLISGTTYTLSPGGICTVSLSFTPTAAAGATTRTANLGFVFAGTAFAGTGVVDPAPNPASTTVSVTGTATTAPVITVTGPSTAYDTVVGTPVVATFRVNNTTGTAALRLDSLAVVNLTNAGEYSLATASTKPCATGASNAVAAGDFCNVAIRFSPANTSPVARLGTLQITHNAGSQTDVALAANATQARADLSGAALTGLPNSPALAFGNVNRGSNAVQSFVVTNGGTATLNFTAFTVTGDYARSGTCAVGTPVAVGGTCTVSVTFTPTAAGSRSGDLSFTSDAPATPAVALGGTGVDLSEPDITPASLTVPAFASTRFDTFNATTQTLTIRNPRANAITLTATLVGSNPGDFVLAGDAACGTAPTYAIAGGSTCTFGIRFKPLAAAGVGGRSATLALDFTGFNLDPSPVDKNVSLSGTASAPAPVFEISSPADGRIAIQAALGSTAPGTAVIKNSGDATLTLTSVAIASTTAPTFPGDYGFAAGNTCTSGSTLAAGATCNLVVNFTPGASGARPAAVAVTHNATGSPSQIPLDGVGGQQAVISATPSALSSFGTVALGNSSTQTVVVANSGVAGAPAFVVTAFNIAGAARTDYTASGDCTALPKTLAQGQSCSLVLSFAPSATGQRSATLDVVSTALNTLTTLALEGAGQNLQPSVTVTPATAVTSTLFNTTSPTAVVVRISNPRSNAIGYSRTLGGANAADFSITAESCAPATVPAGGFCTITLQFRPTSGPGAGTRNANLALTFTGSGSDVAPAAQTASFSGVATAPTPVFGIACGTSSPCTTLGFTAAVVGSNSATINNSGTANLIISAYGFAGPAKDEFALASSNTCTVGTAVAAGANCTLALQFTPTTTGLRTATLTVFHNASGGTYDLALEGTATTAPVPVIDTAGTTTLAYGNVALGATSTQSFTVRNTGTAALVLSSIGTTGAAAGDFTRTGTCSTATAVAPGASCTVVMAFAPTAAGTRTATVTVSSNASNAPPAPTVTLSGTGLALAEPVLTPLPLDAFPLTLTGTTSNVSRVLTVTNPRANAISYAAALGGANAADFKIANESCATHTVAAGASCTLTLQFAPTAAAGAGARSATLALAYVGSGTDPTPTAANVALAGSAVLPAPSFSISSTALVLSAVVGTPGTGSAVITNTGTAALALSNLSFSGVSAGEFSLAAGNTCTASTTLVPSSSCTLVVRYAPATAGTGSAALTISHNAATSPQTVTLTGTATPAPQGRIVLSALSLVFPGTTVGSTSLQTVVVLNAGDAALNFSSFAFAGAAAADYTGSGSCAVGTPLAVAAQCTLAVAFKPTGVGARSAALAVQSDASNGAATIALTGTGVAVPAPKVGLNPADTLEFGTQTVGGLYAARKVTLSNTGNADLTGLALSVDGLGFTLAGTSACPAALAAGESCEVQVAFAAAAAGADYTGNLRVTSNAAGSPLLLPLHGRGTSALVPVLVWQPLVSKLDFGSVTAGSVSATQSVTLLNQGPGGVNISVLNAVGADAAAFSVTAGSCELGTPLFQGQTCRIDVRFAPGTAGAKTATVQLASSGSAPEALALTGTGLGGPSPGLAVSATALRFDLTRVGAQSLPSELTISATGSGVVRVTAMAASAGWVVQNKTCPVLPFTLAAGGGCIVTLTFVPTAEGAATGKLSISTDSATATVDVALSGQGEAKPDVVGGGCSIASGETATDPTLWLLVLAALVVLVSRRSTRARRARQVGQ